MKIKTITRKDLIKLIIKKFFKKERLNKILEIINERGFVSIRELQESLGVSEVTIRRDIKELNDKALAQKVYGGIKKIDSDPFEAQFAERRMLHSKEKILIAHLAIELVKDGDNIFIDASSTSFEFAKLCREKRNNLHVATNSLMAAIELLKNPTNTVTMIGGTLRNENASSIGIFAEEMAKNLNVEKAFLSCRTFMPSIGTFETNSSESLVKKTMVENSDKVYLLVDSSKFFKRAIFFTIPIDEITAVITDEPTNKKLIDELPSNVKIFNADTRKG